MTQRDLILSLCSRPDGWSLDEAPEGMTRSNAFCIVSRLVVAGHVFRGSLKQWARYYTNPLKAEAYTAAMREEFVRRDKAYRDEYRQHQKAKRAALRPAKPGPTPYRKPAKKRGKATEAPVKLAEPKVKWADLPPQITSETTVTLCKSPAHFGPAWRLHLAPRCANPKPLRVGEDV